MTGSMELQLMTQERLNAGTTLTRNDDLEKNGYVVVDNFYNPVDLYHPLPKERGIISYYGTIDKFDSTPENQYIPNSLSRNSHPQYEKVFSEIREKVEKVINRSLYNTFYTDQFFVQGNILPKHLGRNAMEIGVEVMVSTNVKEDWPLHIKTPNTYTDDTKQSILVPGEEKIVNLKPGSAVIFKGCEIPTWRETLSVNKKKNIFSKFTKSKTEEIYYHSVYFYYVLADGERSHCAYDMSY